MPDVAAPPARAERRRALAARRPELTALALLVVAGVLLRAYFVVEWRPAITGYSDSGIYFQNGVEGAFTDPFRTVGYSLFLIALHWVTPHLLLVTLVQHAMGLATGVLLFLAVRASGAPAGLGLVPAAVTCLGGTQLFLEHAALSETLFMLLLAGILYAAVRAQRGGLGWAVAAGGCAGLAGTVREAGLFLAPLVVGWLLLSARRPTRATVVRAGIALAVSVAIVGGYVAWRHAETGRGGVTTNGVWNFYGRVAPFADCARFDPPAGTEPLCDPLAPASRNGRGAQFYVFSPESPAQRAFGPPYYVSTDPGAPAKLRRFSLAALRGQPGDYLAAVADDAIRLVVPGHPSYGDLSGDDLVGFLLGGPDLHSGRNDFVAYWQGRYYPHDRMHHGDLALLKGYERITRFEGPLMVLLLLLAAPAPWLVRGRPRAAARLFALIGFALLLFPMLTKGYDYRFVVPALAPLSAAAALAVSAGWSRLRAS
ncbi:MAG: hypothetical protein QOE65_2706 [Solirubrobacteraceae bacterium]|jgi:hypothetical protein|nr:hypothetical protein [Solirubrobacteraceae bacterium]